MHTTRPTQMDRTDPEDLPGPPLATVWWLHDEEPRNDEWESDFRPHQEDPA